MAKFIPVSNTAKQYTKNAIARGIKKDIYKKVETQTGVCLVCKEFSKHRTTCPRCERNLLWFGGRVAKVKKGDKTGWRKFIKAYAGYIYSHGNQHLPFPEYEKIINAVRCPLTYYDRMHMLAEWVVKYDKFLDRYRR